MKVVNVVLSVLILLLAVASAVFSFFLFEKRSQLVDGWKKLAVAIHQSATEMDKGSGTKSAEKLTASELAHEKFDELDRKLSVLTDQSRNLTKQRDELAETLRRIGSMAEMNNVAASDTFRSLASYSVSKDEVVQGVGTLAERRNKIAQTISKAAQDHFRMNIDSNKLRAADQGALDQFAQRLNKFVKERSDLERALAEVSGQVGAGRLDFTGDNFQDSINKIKQAVNAMKGKLADADRAVATRNQEIQKQRTEITGKDGEIGSLKKQLEEKNYQLDSLRTALGLPNDAPLPMPWKPGSPEVRKRVVGRVADVSDKYGYIAIDLGTESTVPQELGNKVGQISVALAPGLEMVVSRGDLEVPTADYITKVKLTKVEKDGSIAEPIGAAKGSVRVGDKVWFDIN